MTKIEMRKAANLLRSRIPEQQRSVAAKSAADIFIQQSFFTLNHYFACYLPLKNEFDSSLVIEAIWQAQKLCYLPVLDTQKSQQLFFVRYDYGDALHRNQYSILEPKDTSRRIAAEELEVVITPLVAFDKEGGRLGTGGGYYDRAFQFLQTMPLPKPLLIGMGYSAQEVPKLPTDPWDIKLTGIITEKQFIVC